MHRVLQPKDGSAQSAGDTEGRRQSSTLQQGLLGISGTKELAGENCLESPESMNQHQSAKVMGPLFFHQRQKLST